VVREIYSSESGHCSHTIASRTVCNSSAMRYYCKPIAGVQPNTTITSPHLNI